MLSIQISVILWTVICFILLMIILRNLLFKPLLTCMDDRKKRIDAAMEKRQQYDREIQLAEASGRQAEKEAEAHAKAEAERMVAKETKRTEQLIAHEQAKEKEACRAYRQVLEKEKSSFDQETQKATDKLGELFVSRFAT